MIEAALDAPEGAMTLRVKGHARFAAPGSDIVCAAASALVWAAAGSVEELSARGGLDGTPVLRTEKGAVFIHARAKPCAAAYLAGAAGVVETGFKRLSEGFPENVRFTGGHADVPFGQRNERRAEPGMEELYEKQRSGL